MLQQLKELFERRDRFAKLLGFRIVEMGEGYAKVEAEVTEDHLNAADVLHGGFLFSLADYAFAVASNSRNDLSLAVSANILFHKGISGGTVTATAREIQEGKRIAGYLVEIRDGSGTLLATFTGTVYRKGTALV